MFTANELLAFPKHLTECEIAPTGGISPEAVTYTVSEITYVLQEMTDMGPKYQKYLSAKGA